MKSCSRERFLHSVTSVILIPLFAYAVFTFLSVVANGGAYTDMIAWVQSPYVTAVLFLIIVIGFYYGAAEMEIIIDDYVHHEFLRANSIRLINLGLFVFAVAGLISLAKIVLGAPV